VACHSVCACDGQMEVALSTGQCVHSVCNTLAMWERMGRYFEYVEFLHRHLLPVIRSERRTEVEDRLWRQLIVVSIVFSLNLIEVSSRSGGPPPGSRLVDCAFSIPISPQSQGKERSLLLLFFVLLA
jgi:hypothetical protein